MFNFKKKKTVKQEPDFYYVDVDKIKTLDDALLIIKAMIGNRTYVRQDDYYYEELKRFKKD